MRTEDRKRKTEDGERMAEKRRISNPSTGLRTGIEQGMTNDEGLTTQSFSIDYW